ncbi:hypothetical protein [Bradyrhizobium uaiense]
MGETIKAVEMCRDAGWGLRGLA